MSTFKKSGEITFYPPSELSDGEKEGFINDMRGATQAELDAVQGYLENSINNVGEVADTAKETADTAQGTANAATTTAGEAMTTANAAQATADNALPKTARETILNVAAGGSVTANFASYDKVTIIAAGEATIEISNAPTGQIPLLIIQNFSNSIISFTNIENSSIGNITDTVSAFNVRKYGLSTINLTRIDVKNGIFSTDDFSISSGGVLDQASGYWEINNNVLNFQITISMTNSTNEVRFNSISSYPIQGNESVAISIHCGTSIGNALITSSGAPTIMLPNISATNRAIRLSGSILLLA